MIIDREAVGKNRIRLLLIRHAKAKNRETWTGDDWVRPLKKRGRRQAAALAKMLRGWGVTTIRSSPALRCVQTVEPLASELGLSIEIDSSIAEGCRIRLPTEPGVHVICAHGDNIPHLLGVLGVKCDRCQTASVTHVDLDSTGIVLAATYQRASDT